MKITWLTYVASGGARTKFQKIEYGAKPRPRRARSQVNTQDRSIFFSRVYGALEKYYEPEKT